MSTSYKGNNTVRLSGETSDRNLNGIAAAWVNFNGTGTVAIREDNNVSSITDNGTGDYSVNFTASMNNSDFSFIGSAQEDTGGGIPNRVCTPTRTAAVVGSKRMATSNLTTLTDSLIVCAYIFGDLA